VSHDVLAVIAERWPELRVDGEALAAELERRGVAPTSPFAADVALASALAGGEPAALAIFDRAIVPDVRGALVRFGRDDDFVAEVLQRVRVKLLVGDASAPRIGEYQGRGPLAAWVQIVAIREGLQIQRSTAREVAGDEQLLRLAVTDPAFARSSQVYKAAFAAAFQRAMTELGERERTLLRLCFVEGVGTDGIARLFHVHRVTAFRWLRDAREVLLETTRTHFLAAADVPASEVDSVMRSAAHSLSVPW